MALTPTIGVFWTPFKGKDTDKTPQLMEAFQTSGSGVTQGVLQIIGTATADSYFINHVTVWTTDPTAASLVALRAAGAGTLAGMATATLAPVSMSFGPIGIMLGDAATNTLALVSSGGTCTMNFVVTGYKLK